MQTEFDPHDTEDLDQQRTDTAEARELASKQEAADFTWLMNDPRGRRIVWAQLALAGVFRSTFDPNPIQSAFNEGNRNHGLRLMTQLLSLTPEQYHTMTKENAS